MVGFLSLVLQYQYKYQYQYLHLSHPPLRRSGLFRFLSLLLQYQYLHLSHHPPPGPSSH